MRRDLTFIFLLLVLSPLIIGAAGVSPSYYDIDFKPNLEEEFSFTFFFEGGTKVDFEVLGDLSDYAKIVSKKQVLGNQVIVTVRLSLPENIDVPGLHTLRISGKEEGAGDGISLNLNVRGLIWVRVPYPAKYAEMSLQTGLTNQGEDLPYELTVYSRGEEDILINSYLEVESLEGEPIDKIILDSRTIKSTEKTVYEGNLSTDTYFPGDYILNAVVEYDSGKFINESTLIRLGELKVRIVNYTSTYEKEKLSRFDIDVESLWNNKLSNVYAEVSVINYPLKSFSTPSINLEPWDKKKLSGVLDTHEINEETIQLKINVVYADRITSQIVDISLEKTTNWTVVLIIVGALIILAIVLILIIYIIKLKHGQTKKE